MVDELTNSIRNIITGDSFQTEISRKNNVMGYIKEPKGVDFVIKSNPLTDKDRIDISKLISYYKKKSKQMKENKTINPSRKKVAA